MSEQEAPRAREIRAQVNALSSDDWSLLMRASAVMARGVKGLDPLDALQEAIMRALSGARQWPAGVPFQTFLLNATRSVISAQRKKLEETEILESDLAPPDARAGSALEPLAVCADDPESALLEAEKLAMRRDQLMHLRKRFAADVDACAVVDAFLDEQLPKELMRATKMTRLAYEASRKRLRRAIRASAPATRSRPPRL